MCDQSLQPRGVSVAIVNSSHQVDEFAQSLGGETYQIFPRQVGFIKYIAFPTAEKAEQFRKSAGNFPNVLSVNAIVCP
jgi:hypothetical protein